ncbi:CBM20 domain-containing protein [Streptosporangium canum]|uniref:CBM20 domain-containing protein n=1 Tax=Streptosporangium canum TaxID=324952 RepID=UPI0037A9310D
MHLRSRNRSTVKIPANDAVAIHVNAKADITEIATTFDVTADLASGQTLHVVGNLPALGGWNPGQAVALSSADYPIWRVAVNLPPDTTVEYKYVKKNPDGSVTWESGGNRALTTPSTRTHTSNDTWR